MASIKVKYRPSSMGDSEGTVYYQVIHERKVRQLLTPYKIFQHEWNPKRSMVTVSQESERKPLILSIREGIRWDVERLTKIIRNLDSSGLTYTSDDVIEEFENYSREYSLFNFMESQVIRFKRKGRLRTSDTYRATLNSFKKFREGCDIMLDCLNSETMESYEAWLRQRGVVPNTISFYTRILRATYNRAVEDGIIENRHPFRHVYTGVDKTVKRALPLAVIKKIKRMDLSMIPALDYARDMFILSFMLRGMSFVDMAFLKKTDLKDGYVTYRRRKTGQQLTIAWTKDMQAILDKYPENPTRYLLPIIHNPNVSERYAYHNTAYNINYNLKAIARNIGITIPLTLYVARHSWASAAKAKGIPLSVISEGMGHDSEATTQIYLASLETTIIDKANSIILNSL